MKADKIMQLARKNILELAPYSTARDEYKGALGVFLDANENPFNNAFNRYPDPTQKELKERVCAIKGIATSNIFLGNGSDEAIDLCYRVFCNPGADNVVSIAPSYGMYKVCADINNIEFRQLQLQEDFSLSTEDLLKKCDSSTKLIFVCSPNNPSGNIIPIAQIEEILKNFNGILVIDEAYIDFASSPSATTLLGKYSNLIILQTFSKAYGMAGLRIGMAFACKEIISLFNKVKYPYNLSTATIKTAISLLQRDVQKEIDTITEQREFLTKELAKIDCVKKVYPSQANFLLIEVTDAKTIYNKLIERQIIVRDRSKVKGCDGCLRISIGTPQENLKLLAALKNETVFLGDRTAEVTRNTKETQITATVALDGSGESEISTGVNFLDHMLYQIVHHCGIYMNIKAKGDLQVDEHHTIEDVAIVLGDAISKALGSKMGIGRYGFTLPMDDCKALVLIDLGGRIDFDWNVEFTREYVGDLPTEMLKHFFKSLSCALNCNLHISASGENNHHKAEAIFKGFARALKMAIKQEAFNYQLPSSKGIL